MIPQLIYLAIVCVSIGISLEDHGKPKEGEHNAWYGFVAITIHLLILYAGGFFDVMLTNN